MSLNYNDGIINTGYHDSDTMELDRGQYGRPSSRQKSTFNHNHSSPYDDDNVGYQQEPTEWRGGRGFLSMNSVQPEFDYNREIPRYSDSRNNPYEGQINPVFQHEQEPSYFGQSYERLMHMDNDPSEGDTNVRRRSKKQSFLPMQTLNTATPDSSPEQHAGLNYTQENEKLVEKLTEMSNDDIDKEIRKLQRSLNDKRVLRNQVIKIKQRSAKSQRDCCSGCIYSVKKTFRKARRFASDVSIAFKLWHSTLKVIEGKFGTSILSYFIFLRWLLAFNIFSFIINFSFITIPQFFDMSQNNLSFSGLELLTGAGYFEETILYYGFYTNSTIQKEANLAPYNMQLAYIFTIGLYLATCFLILLYSMGKSYRDHFINPASFSGNAAKLLCSWDFSITNVKAVDLKKKHLSTQIKETLSEKLMEKLKLTLKEKIARFSIHVVAWILSTGIAVGCCAGVYELCTIVDGVQRNITVPLTKQASTLVVPVVVSLINLLVPLVYATLGLMETYKYPRHYIYAVIIRNVLLKISIIGILCYYWLNYVAKSDKECWESYVGQDIYRLVVIDFLFALIGSLFGELVRRIIGTHCCKKLGKKPEFDIARNVLDLIYAQTLAWIGIFFSPLLPLIQMIKLFIIFYLKTVSLMMNCIPPRRAWRASQMTTIFIFLLFFPSFAGVLCVIGVTVWRTHPSKACGPFQSLDTPYESITNWMATINFFVDAKWIVWIYNNIVTSVLFFYILTLIILIISYLYMQIVRGRKIMVKHLLKQIGNEGNDKVFLLKELRKTHNSHIAPAIVPYEKQPPPSQGVQEFHIANESKASLRRSGSIGATDALALAMMARHEAELEEDTQAANERNLRASRGKSDAMAMIMRARQEAEAEATGQPGTSEALAMAMRARQQAEMDR